MSLNTGIDMSSLLDQSEEILTAPSAPILPQRFKVIEDLLESVLKQECGQELVDLLRQLRSMCSPEGQALRAPEAEVLKVVEKLDLNEAIRAARAFALYFQLINIVEQHYEQQESISRTQGQGESKPYPAYDHAPSGSESFPAQSQADLRSGPAERLENSLYGIGPLERNLGTFHWLFPRLKSLNVPPRHIQDLLNQLDVKLVFTAHPTEIVRQTIRDKQRRIVRILSQLDHAEATSKSASTQEIRGLQQQLTEEILLWWRTDELHQFKPTVLDEVESSLHYFQEILFDVIPLLYERLRESLANTFPDLHPQLQLLQIWFLGRFRPGWQPLGDSPGDLANRLLSTGAGAGKVYPIYSQANQPFEPVPALERYFTRAAGVAGARPAANAGGLRSVCNSVSPRTLPVEIGLRVEAAREHPRSQPAIRQSRLPARARASSKRSHKYLLCGS